MKVHNIRVDLIDILAKTEALADTSYIQVTLCLGRLHWLFCLQSRCKHFQSNKILLCSMNLHQLRGQHVSVYTIPTSTKSRAMNFV